MAQRCVHPFMIWPGGVPTAYPAGRLVEDSDPILKTHRHHFEGVEDIARRNTLTARTVEAATADPGELRTLTPPAAAPPDPFDPSEHNAPEVLAYLADADEAEAERVLAAEAVGKARKGILGDSPTE